MSAGLDVFDAPPVDLSTLSPQQLRNLSMALFMLASAEDESHIVQGWRRLHDVADKRVLLWVVQRAVEVDDEQQRQDEILDAAELDLAGGHITWVDFDIVAPEMGWWAHCRCKWWRRCLPSEEAAKRACEAHEQEDTR